MIAGMLCLIYFAALLSAGMDFSLVWLAGAVVCLLLGVLLKRDVTLPVGVKLGGGLFLGCCLLFFLVVEGLIFSGMFAKGRENLDYLIVLGAQVRGKEPSRALKKRLDRAVVYLKENPETRVVVSGGKGDGEEITEAEAMEVYLLKQGVETERIVREDRSTDTVENLKFTGELIDRTASIGIVTNNFHIYRSLGLAKKQGYTDVCGLAAPSDPFFQVHYLVREFFAVVKEWIFGNM